jgi:pimeloyl-ACP methyl ester carboxylesterase
MHGRQNNTIETEFLFNFPNSGPGRPPVADNGQIQLDVFGRVNGAGYHWAGEADVFEAISAVEKRFRIDEKRIILRGFSMGGEGAWHIALHYPGRFAAAEIGAGAWSPRASMPGLEPYQYAALRIWENMPSGRSTSSIYRWPDTTAIATLRLQPCLYRRPVRPIAANWNHLCALAAANGGQDTREAADLRYWSSCSYHGDPHRWSRTSLRSSPDNLCARAACNWFRPALYL